MNETPKPLTETVPAESIMAKFGLPVPTSRTLVTTGTTADNFQDAEGLLSDKPLRRPSRTRPLDP